MSPTAAETVTTRWESYVTGSLPPNDFWKMVRDVGTAFIGPPTNAWLVARFGDVQDVLSDETRFKHVTSGPGSPTFRDTLLDLEGERHRQRLGLVGGPLKSRSSLEGHVRPRATEQAQQLMAAMRGRDRIDIALELNEPLPLLVITEMVDVPAATQFRRWYQLIATAGSSNITDDPEIRAAGMNALQELYDFLAPLLEERRRNPGDDLLSTLAQAEFDGARLNDDEIKSFTALILVGGVETTARSLTNLQRQLLGNPELWAAVRDDRELVLPASAEALRHSPPVQGLTRIAATPYDIAGTSIAPGERLYASIYSANHDDTQFPDPDAFVLTRFVGDAPRQFSPTATHMAFGGGRHFCTGAQLAKVEMDIVMNTALDAIKHARIVADAAGPLGERLGSPNSLEIAPDWA